MNTAINNFENELRNSYLRESKLQNKEARTGIPREEYQEDKQYKAEVTKRNDEYKTRSKTIQFLKPEPSLFTMYSFSE